MWRWPTILWLVATAALVVWGALNPAGESFEIGRQTLMLAIGAAVVALVCGSALAVTVWRFPALIVVCVAAAALPMFVHVSAWDSAFGRLGWLQTGSNAAYRSLLPSWLAAIWIHGIAATPLVAVLIVGYLRRSGKIYEEQGLLDGDARQVFWRSTVYRLWPVLVALAIWTMLMASRDIAVSDIYQIKTWAEVVYLGFYQGQLDNWWAAGVRGGLPGSAWEIVVITAWLLGGAVVCVGQFCLQTQSTETAETYANSRRSWPDLLWCGVGSLVALVALAVPLANLVLRAAWQVDSVDSLPTPRISLGALLASLARARSEAMHEAGWSIGIATLSATLSTLLAMACAWQSRRSRWWRMGLLGSIVMALAFTGPMIGVALIRIFDPIEFLRNLTERTLFLPTVAAATFYWPIAGLLCWKLVNDVPQELIDAATTQGAGSWRQFLASFGWDSRVQLLGLWLLLFALNLGEWSATQMVVPAGMDTLSRLELGLLHVGADEMACAVALWSGGLVALISMLGWTGLWLNRRRRLPRIEQHNGG